MNAVERIHEEDFNGYLSSFQRSAAEVDAPMSDKLKQLCAELEPIVEKLAQDHPWPGKSEEAATWVRKLDDLQGALAACTTAQGVASVCRPFYDKVDKLIRDCRAVAAARSSQ